MDISSSRNKTNYWQHQQDVNPSNKNQIKMNVDQQSSSHFSGNVQFYGENNNQFKRSLSGADQRGSPFKKRNFSQTITPPTHTDEEDDDDDEDEGDSNTGTISPKHTNGNKKDESRRRAAHTAAEQKRRNAIRKGYDALQGLVPNSHLLDPISSQKVSKAAILKRSTDYLCELNKEKQQLTSQLEAKQKETYCLRAVQKAYEDILEMNMHSAKNINASIDDEHKFRVFQNISESLFSTFDQAMQPGQPLTFSQFTTSVLRWIEDSCRPTDINETINRVVGNLK